jgi:hypothetical protein
LCVSEETKSAFWLINPIYVVKVKSKNLSLASAVVQATCYRALVRMAGFDLATHSSSQRQADTRPPDPAAARASSNFYMPN